MGEGKGRTEVINLIRKLKSPDSDSYHHLAENEYCSPFAVSLQGRGWGAQKLCQHCPITQRFGSNTSEGGSKHWVSQRPQSLQHTYTIRTKEKEGGKKAAGSFIQDQCTTTHTVFRYNSHAFHYHIQFILIITTLYMVCASKRNMKFKSRCTQNNTPPQPLTTTVTSSIQNRTKMSSSTCAGKRENKFNGEGEEKVHKALPFRATKVNNKKAITRQKRCAAS